MHSLLQRKLKNLHREARVWGSSTPRPPPLIVQPNGGLSSKAGSVHGANDPGGELFAPGQGRTQKAGQERRTARGSPQAAEEEVPLGRGQPLGRQRHGHTPVGSNVTLWNFSK